MQQIVNGLTLGSVYARGIHWVHSESIMRIAVFSDIGNCNGWFFSLRRGS